MLLSPTNRLVTLAFAVALPVLTVAGYAGGGAVGALAALAVLVTPAIIDAALGRHQAGSLGLSMDASHRATQGRPFAIGVRLDGGGRARLALDPPDGWDGALEILEPAPGPARRTATWTITPRDRGRVLLAAIFHESVSPLGLWHWRSQTPVQHEFRIFPDLREDRGALAPLFLRKAAIGLHRSRAIGKGREFEQLREYLPGDGYEDIEWKATARRMHPVTKIHRVERSQDVYVIVDASRRSARRLTGVESPGGQPPTQMDRFVRAGLSLTLAALQQGDRPGLAVFGSTLKHFHRANSGRPQYNACRDKLFDLQASPHPPDFADLFAELRNRVRQRALLIFLTDLDDPILAAHFASEVSVLSKQHLVLVGQLHGPGTAPLFEPARPPASDDEVYQRLAGHLLWEGTLQTKARLRARGVHCVSATAESLVADMISAYLDLKRRQLL